MDFANRFSEYFERDVAQKAAKSLTDGAEIEIVVGGAEVLTLTRNQGKNRVTVGRARDPQLVFTLTPAAAEEILAEKSDEIGKIGVGIARLIVSKEADKKVSIQIKAGFLSLFSKGYFGVLAAGGAEFASFLASRGLNGMGAIKSALKNLKG